MEKGRGDVLFWRWRISRKSAFAVSDSVWLAAGRCPISAIDNLFLKEPRIIGGSEASSTRYPYTVALTNGGSNFFCGGSLIASDMVLTAAHCLRGGGYNVAIGRHDLTSSDGEEVPVDQEIRHPSYSFSTDEYDFALLLLTRSATVVTAVDLVRINNDESFPSPGETARVMGWATRRKMTKTRRFRMSCKRSMCRLLATTNAQRPRGRRMDSPTVTRGTEVVAAAGQHVKSRSALGRGGLERKLVVE
ncbi:hypothetical protein ACHAWX_000511 [Stephanocyclus meneghinianus]